MKTWKREKEKGRERNWKKERKVAGKEKEDLLLKRGSMVFSLIQGGEVWALEKGTVVFSCYYFALCCKLFQV